MALEEKEVQQQAYDADQIQVLEGLEAVRKRPGMYIGSTSSKGLHHLVWEIVDNSIDEALAGYCTDITVAIEKDNWIRVEDNGRGIPVSIQEKMGIPAVEVVYTIIQKFFMNFIVKKWTLEQFRQIRHILNLQKWKKQESLMV